MILEIVAFLLMLSFIVFVHEFGHYIVAKKSGVKIVAFSIGFGPEIFGWNDKSDTRWKISAVPLGGYVQMFGDEGAASTPDNEQMASLTPEEAAVAFHSKSLLIKSFVVLAGPVANFILTIVMLACIFMYYGRTDGNPVVLGVQEGSVAESVGLREGDVITSIAGDKIRRFQDISDITAANPGKTVDISFIRGNVESVIAVEIGRKTVQDKRGRDVEIGRLGIIGPAQKTQLGIGSALQYGAEDSWYYSVRTLKFLGQIVTGERRFSDMRSVVGIGDVVGQAVTQSVEDRSFQRVFFICAMISLSLGIFNLFPIPMLDGGHLLFYVIEAIRGKKMNARMQEYFFRAGFAALILLVLVATFNDLRRFGLFGGLG